MSLNNARAKLRRLRAVIKPAGPKQPFIVEYPIPISATPEEREAAKAAAMERFKGEHPEYEDRDPIICLGLEYEPPQEGGL